MQNNNRKNTFLLQKGNIIMKTKKQKDMQKDMLLEIIGELREENKRLDSQNRKLFNDNRVMHKKIVDLETENKALTQMVQMQDVTGNLPLSMAVPGGSISVTDVEAGE